MRIIDKKNINRMRCLFNYELKNFFRLFYQQNLVNIFSTHSQIFLKIFEDIDKNLHFQTPISSSLIIVKIQRS